MAKSRRPVARERSQLASRLTTTSAPTVRGSEPSRRPATEGTAAARGTGV
ncbi:MAG: hypothetical protein M3Z50_12235 [Actinomycetota bacterium]|nr:hypothetical protein [Actinomycetota bacterium]